MCGFLFLEVLHPRTAESELSFRSIIQNFELMFNRTGLHGNLNIFLLAFAVNGNIKGLTNFHLSHKRKFCLSILHCNFFAVNFQNKISGCSTINRWVIYSGDNKLSILNAYSKSNRNFRTIYTNVFFVVNSKPAIVFSYRQFFCSLNVAVNKIANLGISELYKFIEEIFFAESFISAVIFV